MRPVARASSDAGAAAPSVAEVHEPEFAPVKDLPERPASSTESLHPEDEDDVGDIEIDVTATAAASSPPPRRRRGSVLRRRRRIVSPQQPKSASLLRRVLSRSTGRPKPQPQAEKDDATTAPTLAAASIRRNLSDVFREDSAVSGPPSPTSTSPPHRFRQMSRRKKRKKKPHCEYDDDSEEIIFKRSATKSVFESAWCTDDDASQSSSPRFRPDNAAALSPGSTPERMHPRPTAVSVESVRRCDGASRVPARTVSPGSPLRSLRCSGAHVATMDEPNRSHPHPLGSALRAETDHDDRAPRDEDSIKIFVLLLQPEQKIYELIQLIFSSQNGATVGDLLQAIPDHATQPDLVNQEYTGFTRPKKRSRDFVDPDTRICSALGSVAAADSIDVQAGEILVALPRGYSHNRAVAMSKKILLNPRIQKLLERPNPLAPRSSTSRRRSARHQTPVDGPLYTMEKVVEETTMEVVEQGDPILRVMDFAAELAKGREVSASHQALILSGSAFVSPRPINHQPETPKAGNTHSTQRCPLVDSVPETASPEVSLGGHCETTDRPATVPGVLDAYLRATSATSVRSFRGLNGHLDDASIDSSLCSSLQSYSSWSQSFDISLKLRAGTPTPLAPVGAAPAARVNPYLKRSWLSSRLVRLVVPAAGVVYCVVMVAMYAMDPDGCSHQMEIMQRQPLGLWGMLQVVAGLVVLTKFQRNTLFGRFNEAVPVATVMRNESRRYRIRSSLLR